MFHIRILSDEWFPRYDRLKNLHIKLYHSVAGTGTRGDYNSSPVLRTCELKSIV